MRRPRSIRGQITLVAAAVSALVLGAVAAVTVLLLRCQLADNLDEGLAQRADTIAAALTGNLPEVLGVDEDLLVQVIGPDGAVLAASPSVVGQQPIAPTTAGLRTVGSVPGRGETFRVLARPVAAPVAGSVLLVGINMDDVTDPVSILIRLFAVSVPCVVAVLGVITWWLTGRTLRPVDELRAEMEAASWSDPAHRVRTPGTGDEVDRLARTLNQSLDRLEDSARRQQRFVADASHELRIPLTRMRAELELAIREGDPHDALATAAAVLEECIALQALVDDLLLLARSDAGAAALLATVPVDLDDIVLREMRRLAERGQVRVDGRGVSGARVVGDPTQLRHAIRNLFDNAERHATTTVTVTLAEDARAAHLTVADDGPGVPPGERAHIFERFTRLDAARTRDAGGTGLGLAITRDIVARHGGTVRVADGPETRFVVELSASPVPTQPSSSAPES